ncbi:hypothetical protein ES703_31189 [subsurface metagenome]
MFGEPHFAQNSNFGSGCWLCVSLSTLDSVSMFWWVPSPGLGGATLPNSHLPESGLFSHATLSPCLFACKSSRTSRGTRTLYPFPLFCNCRMICFFIRKTPFPVKYRRLLCSTIPHKTFFFDKYHGFFDVLYRIITLVFQPI